MPSSVAATMPDLEPWALLCAGHPPPAFDGPANLVSPFAVHPPEAILSLQDSDLDQQLALDERQNSIDPALRSIDLQASYVVRMVSAHAGTLTDSSFSTNNKDPLHISMGMSDAGPASSEFLPLLPEDFLRAATFASLEDDGLPVVSLTPPPAHAAALPAHPLKRICSRRIGDHDSFEFTQPLPKLAAPHTALPPAPHATLRGLDASAAAALLADIDTAAASSRDVAGAPAWNAGLPHVPVGWNPRLQSSLDINRQRRGNRRSIASLDEAAATPAGVTAALAAVAISSSGGSGCGAGHDMLDQRCSARDSMESLLEDDILAEARCWLP